MFVAAAGEVAGAGVPVVTVADVAHPYVEVFVPQAGLAAVRLGGPATLRVDGDRAAYPGREVVLVDARPLFARGGGIHCITQQQPDPGGRQA